MISRYHNKAYALYVGRDLLRGPNRWLVSFLLIPRKDLTREGELILSGLAVNLYIGRRSWVEVRSDADRIARQILRNSNLPNLAPSRSRSTEVSCP